MRTADGWRTLVLTDKLVAVDVGRLGEFAGYLPHDDMRAVDDALRAVPAL